MLLGILLLHYYNFISNGILSAVFSDINSSSIPDYIQNLISICLLIGFGVKLPIIPLHTWLPDAHTNAPTPVSMILAGILLKTGAYRVVTPFQAEHIYQFGMERVCLAHFVDVIRAVCFDW